MKWPAIALWALVGLPFHSSQAQFMSFGVAAPQSSGGCTQATTFLARTSGLSGGTQAAYKAYICGLVTDGVISSGASMASTGGTPYCGAKFDALWWMATANQPTANLDICGHVAYTLVPHGSPDFFPNAGYQGVDGSTTVFLDTSFNPATAGGKYAQNSGHLSAWSLTNALSGASGGVIIGNNDGSNDQSGTVAQYADGHANSAINTALSVGNINVAVADSLGLFLVSRTASNLQTLYKNGSSIGTDASASVPLVSASMYIGARNNVGTAEFGSALRIAMASAGAGLSSGDVASLNTRGCAFLTALNGNCTSLPLGATLLPSPPSGFHWTKTFGDEFDTTFPDTGTGASPVTLNSAVWDIDHGGGGDGAGDTVSNSILTMTIKTDSPDTRNIIDTWTTSGGSGNHAFSQRYGYFVYNVKLPTCSSGEYDIEFFGRDNWTGGGLSVGKYAEMAIASGKSECNYRTLRPYQADGNASFSFFTDPDVGVDVTLAFHQYGILWVDDGSAHGSVSGYFDGSLEWGPVQLSSAGWDVGLFFDVYWSPVQAGDPLGGTGVPAPGSTLQLDWVRAYRLDPN